MKRTLIKTEQHYYPPQSSPPAVQRKPVPASMTAPAAVLESDIVDTKPEKALFSSAAPLSSPYNAPLPPLPARPFLFTRLHARYSSIPKRTRYILLALLSTLLILTVTLVATLASRRSHFSHLPLPSSNGGPYTGDLTYYDPGLGACGVTSTSSDYIVSVSHLVFDAVSAGSNPNENPLCGKKIRASRGGKSVDLTVVDRCTGCKSVDLDVTSTVFAGLASIEEGRVGVSWAWLENVPGGATGS